jgi:hypothetical protein
MHRAGVSLCIGVDEGYAMYSGRLAGSALSKMRMKYAEGWMNQRLQVDGIYEKMSVPVDQGNCLTFYNGE